MLRGKHIVVIDDTESIRRFLRALHLSLVTPEKPARLGPQDALLSKGT